MLRSLNHLARTSWLLLKNHAKAVSTIIGTGAALVAGLAWWQNRVRVTIDVRHYAAITISEAAMRGVRDWVRSNTGRAYEVIDIVWRNIGNVPENNVSILARVPNGGEILTCDLAERSLRPQLRVRRDPNECEVTLDRIASGSIDSVRIRYRSPLIQWIFQCDALQMKADICAAPRPSADSRFPVTVSAEGDGPPMRVHRTRDFLGSP